MLQLTCMESRVDALLANNRRTHHSTYSFDCSTAVLLETKVQNYKHTILINQFYGERVHRVWSTLTACFFLTME